MSGYMGTILKVDLTAGKIKAEELGDHFYRKWLGGYGVGARIVYSETTPKIDPLGPGNILGFTTGVLTGTPVPFNGARANGDWEQYCNHKAGF